MTAAAATDPLRCCDPAAIARTYPDRSLSRRITIQ